MGGSQENFPEADDIGMTRKLSMIDDLTLYIFINLRCEHVKGKGLSSCKVLKTK